MDTSANKNTHLTSHDPLDFATSPPIRVAVGTGPAARDFFVHDNLIRSRSEFFSHALNGAWKESNERTVSLPDDEPEIFAAYLTILYFDKLPIVKVCYAGTTYLVLSKLYVLAEKLIDESTKQQVLTALKGRDDKPLSILQKPLLPEMDSIRVIYSGTPASSPARKLVFDLHARRGQEAYLTTASPSSVWLGDFWETEDDDDVDSLTFLSEDIGAADIPKDFLYDLCIGMMRARA